MDFDKSKIVDILQIGVDQGLLSLKNHNAIRKVTLEKDACILELTIDNPSLQFKNKIKKEIATLIKEIYPSLIVRSIFSIHKSTPLNDAAGVKNIIAIASGKGGVGKSTIASNLAISLKRVGYNVGLIDADIYGPSIPLMFDAEGQRPRLVDNTKDSLMKPVESYGVKIMSIGFFAQPNDALVWRGPMATRALKQIITQTVWGELDYLLIDLPPGTSDIHLSLVQSVSITGAIIVTTPQPVSIIDAKKAINMFKMDSIDVPVLGLIENMSWYLGNGEKQYLFGRDGGKNLSSLENIPLLLELPLYQSIREGGDVGRPAALQETELGEMFIKLAKKVIARVLERNKDLPVTKKVKITHNKGCN